MFNYVKLKYLTNVDWKFSMELSVIPAQLKFRVKLSIVPWLIVDLKKDCRSSKHSSVQSLFGSAFGYSVYFELLGNLFASFS